MRSLTQKWVCDIRARHWVLTFSPLVPPSNAGWSGEVGEHCLRSRSFIAGAPSERSRERFLGRSRPAVRVAQGSREATGTSGVAFFWLLFLAKQEK